MPVPQLAPPGHLDQHSLLVALTPVLLCLLTAGAARIIGGDGRALRTVVALSLLGALSLQALFLLPWGPAAAYTEPLASGWVRVGWGATGAALLCGCWTWWCWRPWRAAATGGVVGWCARVALALSLPVVLVPLLAIPALADVRSERITPDHGRRCFIVGAIAVLATLALATSPALSLEHPWSLHGAVLLACGLVAARGAWVLPLSLAGVLALKPG